MHNLEDYKFHSLPFTSAFMDQMKYVSICMDACTYDLMAQCTFQLNYICTTSAEFRIRDGGKGQLQTGEGPSLNLRL